MNLNLAKISLLLLIFTAPLAALGKTVIRFPDKSIADEVFYEYMNELLTIAMKKGSPQYPYQVEFVSDSMTQGRALQSIRDHERIDIYWTMSSKDREEGLHVIRFPFLKGLLGLRVFVIKQNQQKAFAQIKSLKDLKIKISMGQGHDWPDTDILRSNGFQVYTSTSYTTLYPMLTEGRFIAYPQGVIEATDEVAANRNLKLKVEDKFLLEYSAPLFVFVNKQNKDLIKRLESGLASLAKDGSFDALFEKHWRDKIDKLKVPSRTVYKLQNPNLSQKTRVYLKENPHYFNILPK